MSWFEVGAQARQQALLREFWAALRSAGLGCGQGGKVNELRTRLHVHADDAPVALRLLAAAVVALELDVRLQQGTTTVSWAEVEEAAAGGRFRSLNVWVTEGVATLGRDGAEQRAASVLEIDVWTPTVSAMRSNGSWDAPRSNDVVTSLAEADLRRWLAVDDGAVHGAVDVGAVRGAVDDSGGGTGGWPRSIDSLAGGRNAYARDFPIDVVYTWVDDADPRWRTQRNAYAPTGTGGAASRATLPERFRSRDELRYSLRSLQLFAPFVDTVHLVTMGQVPDWLDVSQPGLRVVDHTEIYADPSALPTFNSSSIETQLHHIDGLAEHFLYLNDDVFFGRPCAWNEFFLANGQPRFFLADHAFVPGLVPDDAEEYLLADRNAEALLRATFGTTVHKFMQHTPHPARRSVLTELEHRFPAAFDRCQRARFRGADDLRPISFLGPHYAFGQGTAVPSRLEYRYLALWKPALAAQLRSTLQSRRYKAFCLNDAGVPPEREGEVDRLLAEFLVDYFPLPSRFER